MKDIVTKLQAFRAEIYLCFQKRKDAIMNLLDALTGAGHKSKSVVQLSQAHCFQRQYSSITDAISDGLPHTQWDKITTLIYQSTFSDTSQKIHRFVLDCTSNPRPFAKKLPDRTITHAPNPAPSNKPICVGHQYSVVALLPDNTEAAKKHWVVPLSAQRVQSDQKGNEVGMEQVKNLIDALDLKDHLSLSIGDSLYGTQACRVAVAKKDNWVHLFRLNSTRNVFAPPPVTESTGGAGRKKEFGDKMKLNDPSTHPLCDDKAQTSWITRQGNVYDVDIRRWKNRLLRGSRQFRSALHPMHVIQVVVKDKNGKPLYKRPLWLAVLGERRDEMDLIQCYKNYVSRYDIEHFFRFGKRSLLMDAYQTPEVEHEKDWWQLCLLAYVQLYLAREGVPLLPQPWERFLPIYKNISETAARVLTPSQTQRGFARLLETIGTPAADCVPRGKAPGRQAGEVIQEREDQSVIFKRMKSELSSLKIILSDSENAGVRPNPETINTLIKELHIKLSKLGYTPTEFMELFQNSG